MEATIKLFDILWRVKNAGPSPDDNKRTELYFGGCKRALSGNPCPDCFNPKLWNGENCYSKSVKEIADVLDNSQIPKYITIVGGEPTDQLEGLIALGKELSARNYHLMLFTWHDMEWIKNSMLPEEIKYFNIIVTDPYDKNCRIYNTNRDDGIHNVIGSANQHVWLTKEDKVYLAGDLRLMTINRKTNETEVMCYNGR